ncbi:DNA replication and repair protein RecF, partial [Xanthomonas perforans]
MHVVRLSIHRLRRFHTVELHPSSTLNLLTGDNGAGKTSV